MKPNPSKKPTAAKSKKPASNTETMAQLQNKVEASERLQRAVLDAMAYSVISVAPDGRVTSYSAGAEKMLGYTREEFMGHEIEPVIHVQEEVIKRAEELTKQLGRKVNPGLDVFTILPATTGIPEEREWTYIHKSGRRFPVSISVSAFYDEHGKVAGYLGVSKDLTERKKAEAEEARLLAIIDQSPDFVAICDLKGAINYMNAAARKITGIDEKEMRQKNVSDILSPGALKNLHEVSIPAALQKNVWVGDSLLRTADGKQTAVSQVLMLQRDIQGESEWLCMIMRDITEYKRAEVALRESETAVQRLVKNVSEFAVFMLDAQGNVSSWNPGAEKIKGYTADEIIGKHFSIFYTVDEKESGRPQELLDIAVKTGRASAEGWRVRKDGSRFWAHVEIVPLRDEDGTIKGFSKVSTDITERKRSEQMLQRSLREVTNLKQAMDEHALVSITDRQGRIVYANDRFCNISQYSREELIGQNHRIINSAHHPKEFFREMWMTISRGKVWRGEIKNKAKDGSFYWVDSTIVPFIGEDGRPEQYVAIRADITQRKELEEQLIVARDQALQTSQLKSQFLANMSHEIRTPMNGVIGMNSLLLATQLNPDQRHMAELVKNSAESLMTIISDILDFSKIEAGQFRIDLAETDLVTMVEEAVSLMAPRAYSKQVELNCEFIGPFDRLFEADSGRIRQVLLNLIGNALKFTDKGEVNVTVWSWQEAKSKRRVRFEVRDTGIGVSPEKQRQLFQPFVQLNPNGNEHQYGGTGLGLAISRQLVDLMGGEIGVTSTIGSGSIFWFELMLPTLGTIEMYTKRQLPEGLHALVVDDHLTNRRILSEQIKLLGGEATTVGSGPAALIEMKKAHLNGKPYDLMLVDFHMPEMDGMQLAQRIREHTTLPIAEAKIIMISSANIEGDEENIRAVKVDALLRKPITYSQLRSTLLRVLQIHDPQAERSFITSNNAKFTENTFEKPLNVKSETNSLSFNGSDPKPNTFINENPDKKINSQASGSGLKLLVAEDNPTNQLVAQRILELVGHKVEIAVNGAEAIKKLSSEKFDGVLMDCQMPIMDGYAATMKIRTGVPGISKNIPIIGLTAYAGSEDRQRCIAAGMDEYVSKPLQPNDLDRALARCRMSGTASTAAALNPGNPDVLDWNYVEQLRLQPGRTHASLMEDVLAIFGSETPERMAFLKRLLDEQAWEDMRTLSHKVAGSCNALGAKAMQMAALKLEHTAATAEERSTVPERLRELEKEWKRLQEELSKIYRNYTQTPPHS